MNILSRCIDFKMEISENVYKIKKNHFAIPKIKDYYC